MDYTLRILARKRLPSPCCGRFLLYHGARFPGGEQLDRFLCPRCGQSYSLAEAQAGRRRRPRATGQLALSLGARRSGAPEQRGA